MTDRNRSTNPIRAALEQAMTTPRMQQAVSAFVAALVDEGEAVLRQRFGGETLRVYQPKRGGTDKRRERDMRIQTMGTPPNAMSAAQIAALEGLSVRRVEQILARHAKSSA